MTSGVKGTPQWLPPEVAAGKPPTGKSDVYSFGIILWEFASRKPPFHDFQGNVFMLVGEIQRGLRPDIENLTVPEAVRDEYIALMEECWQGEPSARPTFKECLERLRSLLAKLQGKDMQEEMQKLKLASVKFEKGMLLIKSRNFADSKVFLLESFDLEPTSDTLRQLWIALMTTGDTGKCLEVCDKFIATKPNSVLGYEKKVDTLM